MVFRKSILYVLSVKTPTDCRRPFCGALDRLPGTFLWFSKRGSNGGILQGKSVARWEHIKICPFDHVIELYPNTPLEFILRCNSFHL